MDGSKPTVVDTDNDRSSAAILYSMYRPVKTLHRFDDGVAQERLKIAKNLAVYMKKRIFSAKTRLQ